MPSLKRLVMVGGPFSGKTREDQERNIVATELLGIQVAEAGGAPIVPNSMGRTWAGSPSYEVWIEITKSILARCNAFIVTKDWERSSGTRAEVEEAFFAGVPVFYDIADLELWLKIPDQEVRVLSVTTKRRLRTVEAGLRLVVPLTEAEKALAVSLPAPEQFQVIQSALRAVQSLDDLGADGNLKVAEYQRLLFSKYDLLKEAC